MKSDKELEIFVLYASNKNREAYFYKILSQEDVMDSEHYEPTEFWGIYGGIEIVIDGYNTIFHSIDFEYVVKATNFLLHSMYWVKGKASDWFDADEEYPNGVVLRTTNKDLLLIERHSNDKLILSYKSAYKSRLRRRGDKFFEELIFDPQDWYNASRQALSEYFEVLLKIIHNNPNDKTSKTMLGYYEAWKNVDI